MGFFANPPSCRARDERGHPEYQIISSNPFLHYLILFKIARY